MTTRRRFLQQTALAFPMLRFPPLMNGQVAAADPVVRTSLGDLRGVGGDGVRVFRGVPFAAPPLGPLRFLPPVPVQRWSGTRDATQFSASPMQTGEPGVAHSEDCLYLNLWAPEGKGPFPVFVWIHGGGFTGGHSFEPVSDGSQFAREGIVVISLAYRLGVFGFLDFEPMLGPAYAGTANNGLRDLILALEWVQAHVHDFGGDPLRVTIGGESAGAKLADMLMGIPAAQHLFHQVISESGGAERIWPSAAASAEVSQGYAAAWTKATGQAVMSLKTAPAADLIPVQKSFIDAWPKHFPLRAEIDGRLIPQLPIQSIARSRGKRLLIGTNRDESALFLGPNPQHDPTALDLGNLPLTAFDAIYARYKTLYPEMTEVQRRIRAVTAEEYWVPSIRVAEANLQAGGTTYMYRLDFAEASGRMSGYAYHSLDVGLIWDKPNPRVNNAAAEASLAVQMHAAWSTFIRGLAPAAAGLPTWPAYTLAQRPTMILDTVSRAATLPQDDELALWSGKL